MPKPIDMTDTSSYQVDATTIRVTPNPTAYLDSPAGIEAKGRNGYFKLRTVTVRHYAGGATGTRTLRIECNSQRYADSPPIVIEGPAAQVAQLLTMLHAAVDQVLAVDLDAYALTRPTLRARVEAAQAAQEAGIDAPHR